MRTPESQKPGIAMMLVLVVIVVASVLGMSYVSVTTVKLAGSANLLSASRARYLAESGLQHALYLLRTGSAELAGSSAGSPLGPYYADNSSDSYVLYVEPAGPLEYWAAAKGTTRGLTRLSRLRVRLTSNYMERLKGLGPMAYWRLGELSGPVAQDQMGWNPGMYRNGVELGRPGAIAGDLDRSAQFDGINDYVSLGEMDVFGSAMTLLAWFRADDFAVPDGRLISKANGTLTEDHYWMLSTADESGEIRLRFRLKAGLSTAVVYATSGALKAGQWTCAAATYDGMYARIYHNGVQVGSRFKTGLIAVNSLVPAWIGNNPDDDSSRPFHGQIDEVMIFKKCLSGSEILSAYEARVALAKVLAWDG